MKKLRSKFYSKLWSRLGSPIVSKLGIDFDKKCDQDFI